MRASVRLPGTPCATAGGQPSALVCLGVGGAVFLLALASIAFTRDVGRLAAIWPTNAVIVAMLLRRPPKTWWGFLVAGVAGTLAADLVVGDSPLTAIELSVCNCIEMVLCAGLLRRLVGQDIDLGRQRHLVPFLIVCGGLAPFASAVGAGLVFSGGNAGSFAQHAFQWFVPDALGLVVVVPAMLALTPAAIRALGHSVRTGRGLLSGLVLAISLTVVFGQAGYPLLFLIPPALILVAFELDLAGAALALVVTAFVAVAMTLTGHGPAALIHGALAERLGVLQLFLATMALAVLPVAAALAKRRHLEMDLRTSLGEVETARAAAVESQRLSLLAQEIAGVGHWRRDAKTGHSIWSDQMILIHGTTRADLEARPGGAITLYHPEDRPKIEAINELTIATGAPFDLKVRLNRADDGAERIVIVKGEAERVAGEVVAIVGVMRDVTVEETARLRIEESEARYRLLTANATDVIACYGADAVFTFLSPAVKSVMGYEPDELVGKPAASFMHPDDVKPILRKFSAYRAAGPGADPIRFEYRAFRKDGEMVWLEAQAKAVYDEVTGAFIEFQDVIRTITARKAAEAALAESEFRHRLIADNATDIISRMGMDGRVHYFSPSVTDVTGYSLAEVVGASMVPLLHPDDIEPTLSAYRELMAGNQLGKPLAYRVRHKDGHWVWLEGSPTLVRDADGAPYEIIDVRRDVTSKVLLEAELRAARDAAEASAAIKSDFMANMSHEIRTPLTAIVGFTSLLSGRSDLDETARTQVKRVAGAGQALLSIVNDILDFSKLEAGQVEIKPRPVEPDEVLAAAMDLFAPQADAKGLALVFSADGDLPPCLLIDPDRVRQILLNLIGNAIKFTEAGSVRVVAAYDAKACKLEVRVEDSGAGLTKAQQRKLFQRFSQVDASSTRCHGGTGLGLAISKGLAEAMGGEIGVRSRPGQGSVFYFRIAAPVAEIAAPTLLSQDETPLDGSRLLVVDDNPVNRELIRAILSPIGVEVTDAVDGLAAIEAAKSTPFDVILMDIRMPGLDGPAAAAKIRNRVGPNRGIPILAFSADVDVAEFEGATSVFDGVVRKPISPGDLVSTLSRCLQRDESAPNATGDSKAVAV